LVEKEIRAIMSPQKERHSLAFLLQIRLTFCVCNTKMPFSSPRRALSFAVNIGCGIIVPPGKETTPPYTAQDRSGVRVCHSLACSKA
jgi:hypothetical protein